SYSSKGISTIVPDGRRCASACALAWLGGVERFIGTSGKISFHAAYDSASGESGVENAVVDAYLSKIGMPHEAVIYITPVAPNENVPQVVVAQVFPLPGGQGIGWPF